MIILRYHEIFSGWQHQQPCRDTFVLSAWKKSHDIVILSFCNIVKGQARCILVLSSNYTLHTGKVGVLNTTRPECLPDDQFVVEWKICFLPSTFVSTCHLSQAKCWEKSVLVNTLIQITFSKPARERPICNTKFISLEYYFHMHKSSNM